MKISDNDKLKYNSHFAELRLFRGCKGSKIYRYSKRSVSNIILLSSLNVFRFIVVKTP